MNTHRAASPWPRTHFDRQAKIASALEAVAMARDKLSDDPSALTDLAGMLTVITKSIFADALAGFQHAASGLRE